ncbi:VIT1/CCC1 transporter family protein, partial [Nonomuraea fuscirosea]|uniref:VIT1/CCC1 transporter family protein n=1 Tax=Nonomuraea fuscirosea TaxID=1291556 RepID=UPI0034352019
MTIELARPHSPEQHHSHRDVAGGWLRPAVFGAMDGLVSNFALIAGVVGAAGAGQGAARCARPAGAARCRRTRSRPRP